MSTSKCRAWLTAIWLCLGGFIFLLLAVQTMAGKYGAEADSVWAWFGQRVWPTMGLTLGVFFADRQLAKKRRDENMVRASVYWVTVVLSGVYLLLFLAVLLCQPLTETPLAVLMKQSDLYLGLLVTVVATAMGVFFVKGDGPLEG